MGRSKFKESYLFLKDHFTLMIGKPEMLIYVPSSLKFYEDYYEHFVIQCEITKEGKYKLTLTIQNEKEAEINHYPDEKTMLEELKVKMEERKVVGSVKKIFHL